MDDSDYILPEEIECPNCQVNLELEETERLRANFICPNCNKAITEKDLLKWLSNRKVAENKSEANYIENHLVKAILVTLFCCLPFGIASIVQAASVNSKLQAGDFEGARIASEKADSYANWSLGLGLAFGLIYFFATIASLQ